MIATRPQVDPQGLYNITQAAAALEVERHTINRYISNGNLRFRLHKATMRKVITGQAIIKCWEKCY